MINIADIARIRDARIRFHVEVTNTHAQSRERASIRKKEYRKYTVVVLTAIEVKLSGVQIQGIRMGD